MDWIIFALLTPLFWSITAIMDKFLLSKTIKDPISYSILMEFLWLFFILVIIIAIPISFDFPFMLWGIFSGMLDMISYFLYCKLMKIEEASRVIPILYLNVFFTALLAFFFFGEVFTIPKYLGMLALVAGSILLSYKKQINPRKKGLSIIKNLFIVPILVSVILTCFLFASVNIIDKYVLFSVNYWILVVWSVIGEIAVTLFMLLNKKIRKNFVTSVNILKSKKKSFVVMLANEVLGFLAIISSLIAISLGPVSLVIALGTVQPLFVFILTIILSLFMPKILKEEISKSILSLKLFSIVLIIFGTWLVTV